jgi:hypothetical protein
MRAGQGNLKYAVVAVEYFSKWIEGTTLATITLVTIQFFSVKTSFAALES